MLGAGPSALAEDADRVLIIGDSLSDAYQMPRESGWAHLLARRLGARYEVVNASISGETSAGGLSRLEQLLNNHDPDRLLIILGGNDGLRALNPSQLQANLDAMIRQAKQYGVDVALMQIRLPANLGPAYLRRFEAVYPTLADRHDVVLLPFFLESLFDRPGMMMDDGIHPTESAQPLMLEQVWPALQGWLDVDSPSGAGLN
ncbi:arylesterase [Wenzhouxiangella sp. C33]|uniref:Arylesterase n=1 Tax=Wenzhouxiangella limi TaxID=2707351 RepID=A0A845VHP3_9GAMM|nr:arylesterase [Wenzhouxiangella limi]